mgnify:CR=1 FL=1
MHEYKLAICFYTLIKECFVVFFFLSINLLFPTPLFMSLRHCATLYHLEYICLRILCLSYGRLGVIFCVFCLVLGSKHHLEFVNVTFSLSYFCFSSFFPCASPSSFFADSIFASFFASSFFASSFLGSSFFSSSLLGSSFFSSSFLGSSFFSWFCFSL